MVMTICVSFLQVVQGLYRGVHLVAIKILNTVSPEESQNSLLREVNVLRSCRHPHIVQVSSYLWRLLRNWLLR